MARDLKQRYHNKPLYLFNFEAQDGKEYQLRIYIKRARTPEVLESKVRNLGASPTLSSQRQDNIIATSLAITAEAIYDNDYQDLYTSDRYRFLVSLEHKTSETNYDTVWMGFLTPEVLSFDERPVPFDVRLTATDGIGYLKDSDFSHTGEQSIYSHVQSILYGATTLTDFNGAISDLKVEDSNERDMWTDYKVNLSFMVDDDVSNYDALQSILRSFNAVLVRRNNIGYMLRVNDLPSVLYNEEEVGIGDSWKYLIDATGLGNEPDFEKVYDVGNMSFPNVDAWPIGYLSTSMEAARNKVAVVAPNHYKGILKNGDMRVQKDWDLNSIAYVQWDDDLHYMFKSGGGISQPIEFPNYSIEGSLTLTFSALSVYDTDANKVLVGLYACDDAGNIIGAYGRIRYVAGASDYGWRYYADLTVPPASVLLPSFEMPGIISGKIEDAHTYTLEFPRPERVSKMLVKLEVINSDSSVLSSGADIVAIRSCQIDLRGMLQFEGFKLSASINNQAVAADSDYDVCLSPYTDNNYFLYLQGAFFKTPGYIASNWRSARIGGTTGFSYMKFLAMDYALTVAKPRKRREGTVYWKYPRPPMFMKNHRLYDNEYDIIYLVESYEWSIINNECKVNMISASTATVNDVTVGDDKMIDSMLDYNQKQLSKRVQYLERMFRR